MAVLDAGVVNVYQGANAVIFMLDPFRPSTLEKVSSVCVLAVNPRLPVPKPILMIEIFGYY